MDTAYQDLIKALKARFEKHPQRHRGLDWSLVQAKLDTQPEKLAILNQMEATGGEPDVIGFDSQTNQVLFCDCAPESPTGRRSLCYDRAALDGRKENKPRDTVIDMAEAIGIEVLTEEQYRHLQTLGEFDLKTSSWVTTPPAIRQLGGAIFCDRRYNQVFVYHNGAESYYAARGFRGQIQF